MSDSELDLALARALRALPLERPPQDRWQAIARALPAVQSAPPVRRQWPWFTALAASVGVALYSGLHFAALEAPSAPSNTELNALIARSQALESRFNAQRAAPSRLSFEQVEAENQIQMVLGALDSEIAGNPNDPDLWRQRVQVLGALSEPNSIQPVAFVVD